MQNFQASNLKRDGQNLSPVGIQDCFFGNILSKCRSDLVVSFREAKAGDARQVYPVLLIDDLRVRRDLPLGVSPDFS